MSGVFRKQKALNVHSTRLERIYALFHLSRVSGRLSAWTSQGQLSMHASGWSKFLEVNESKVTMVARKRSRPPHFGAEREEQAQVQWGCCQTKRLVREGGTASEAQTKDDREIAPMRTLHAETTSSRCCVGMAFGNAMQWWGSFAGVGHGGGRQLVHTGHDCALENQESTWLSHHRLQDCIPAVQPSFLC